MGTEAGVYWVRDRAWCTQWWSGETPFPKGVVGLLASGNLSCATPNLSLKERVKAFGASTLYECHVVEWLLDSVEAARTGVGILVCSSLEPDGGFQAEPSLRLRNFLEEAARRGHELAEVFAVSPVDMYLRAKHCLAGHFCPF